MRKYDLIQIIKITDVRNFRPSVLLRVMGPKFLLLKSTLVSEPLRATDYAMKWN